MNYKQFRLIILVQLIIIIWVKVQLRSKLGLVIMPKSTNWAQGPGL